MRSQTSSSSESSRSGSPDTRATTPSSTLEKSFLPQNYVYLASTALSLPTLSALFDRNASSGRMGLIVDNSPGSNFATQDHWVKQPLPSHSVEYYTSDTYLAPTLSADCPISTDPIQANQHYIFSLAGLRAFFSTSVAKSCTLHILEKPPFAYPPLSHTTSRSLAPSPEGTYGNIPTLEEWRTLWASWDFITLQMIPREMLHQKPIDLRHKCLFYIGHIPTFLDMLISKSIGGEPTEPKYFWDIFERGIDPHVDDPDHCHNHSEVPEKDDDWPAIETIILFRDKVRARLMRLYDDIVTGKRVLTRNIARTLVMTYEHEGFHVETLLYMLIQRVGSGISPPVGFAVPPWEELSRQWDSFPAPSTPGALVGPATVILGHQDSEGDDKSPEFTEEVVGHTFGWDNESPPRAIQVGQFKAEWRLVTNGEFEVFWRGPGKDLVEMPKNWAEDDHGVKVRTMFGFVPIDVAEHWPVLTSYDDLERYAKYKGGRLPTEPELRLFLDLYDVGHEGGANVGFRHWHPIPGTMGVEAYNGKGSNGGVWEWTSTTFDNHEGLVPTQLFTGYSTDFFDTKHQVVLGASYATIPHLAGRRTVRNFYQHNYPYPWIGARVVYDI